jgi:hypothetical protein
MGAARTSLVRRIGNLRSDEFRRRLVDWLIVLRPSHTSLFAGAMRIDNEALYAFANGIESKRAKIIVPPDLQTTFKGPGVITEAGGNQSDRLRNHYIYLLRRDAKSSQPGPDWRFKSAVSDANHEAASTLICICVYHSVQLEQGQQPLMQLL